MAKQFINLGGGARGFPGARTKLDGTIFKIERVYNEIEGTWSVNIYASDGTPLRYGLPLKHGVDSLSQTRDPALPSGKLGAWDFARQQRDPGRDDLRRGSAVRGVYIPAADVEVG